MKLYMLILFFCVPRVQGIHHDQNYNHVEEKTMEKNDQQLSYDKVKRAISDNNLGGSNDHEIVTTQAPSNTLEYISSKQIVTDSSVDVSLLPLEETTKSKKLNVTIIPEKNNVTSVTGNINTTEQTANLNNGNSNGTEYSVNNSTHPNTSSFEPILSTNFTLAPNYGNTTNSPAKKTPKLMNILNNTTISTQIINEDIETLTDITMNTTSAVIQGSSLSSSVTQSSSAISKFNNSNSESPKILQSEVATSKQLSNIPDSTPFSTSGTLIHTNRTFSQQRMITTQPTTFIKSVTKTGISNTAMPSVSVTTALFIGKNSLDMIANTTSEESPSTSSILLSSPEATSPVLNLATSEPAVPSLRTTNAPPPASIIEDDKVGSEPDATADTETHADDEIPDSEPEPSPKDNNESVLVEPESNENITTAVPANQPSEPLSIPGTRTIDKTSTRPTTVAFSSIINTPKSATATYMSTSQANTKTPPTQHDYSDSTSTTLFAEPSETPISEPEPQFNITSGTDQPTGTTNFEKYTTTLKSGNADPITEPKTISPTPESDIADPTTEPKTNTPTPESDNADPTTELKTNTPTLESENADPTTEPNSNTPMSESDNADSTTEPKTNTPTPESDNADPTTEPKTNTPTLESENADPTTEPNSNTPMSESDNADSTTEPETYTLTPEPAEDDPISEPKGSTESTVISEPEFNFDVFAEPGPDWPVAKIAWKQAWEFHIYFFGSAFVLLGLYCLFCVIHLWKMDHLMSRHYFMTLQVLVMLICLFRASYLLIDAYNSMGTFPIVLDYFLYSTVFPCLTAVFSILFYALLLAIRVRVISEKVQKLWVLLLIIGLHFALSFATDIIVGLFSTAVIMLLICQSFFILWGLIMFVGYLVIFKRLYSSAINRQEAMKRNNAHERKNNITQGFQEKLPKQNYRLGLAVKVTLVCSCFGLACVCFELYGMFGVYGITRVNKPEPWPWWIYHFILRSLEIVMCSSIAFVASQPLKYTYKKKYKDHACLRAVPCRYLCCAETSLHRDEGSLSMDECVVSETDHLGWLKKLKLKKFSSPDGSAPYPPHTAEKYSDPDATLLVRKINKPKPSMLVVEEGFVRIRRDDEMVPANQYDLDSISRSSRASDIDNVNALPDVSFTINERQTQNEDIGANSSGVSNAAFALEDNRLGLQDEIRMSFHGDNRISFQGDIETQNDFADETDIDIAVTDCDESSDEYDSQRSVSDDSLGNSGDIFRPLSDINLAASIESELERAFHTSHADKADKNMKNDSPGKGSRTYKNDLKDPRLGSQGHSDDDWSDSSDGPNRTTDAGLLRRPIRRCKSAESKEQQKSKVFDKNKYFSLSSIDSIGKHEVQSTNSEQT